MCIAILHTAGSNPLSEEMLQNCQANNPDGMGLAWVENQEIKIWKSLKNLGLFKRKYHRAVELNSNILLHFRIQTHGDVNLANCHPYTIPNHPDLVLIHNGTIKGTGAKTIGHSDTKAFINQVLSKLPAGFHLDKTMQHLIEERIGFSRIVFLDSKNRVRIFNQKKGDWKENPYILGDEEVEGIFWFSNSSWKFKKSTVTVVNNRYKGGSPTYRNSRMSYDAKAAFVEGGTLEEKCYCDRMSGKGQQCYWHKAFVTSRKDCKHCNDRTGKVCSAHWFAKRHIEDKKRKKEIEEENKNESLMMAKDWAGAITSGVWYLNDMICWACFPKEYNYEDIRPIHKKYLKKDKNPVCDLCGWDLELSLSSNPHVARRMNMEEAPTFVSIVEEGA